MFKNNDHQSGFFSARFTPYLVLIILGLALYARTIFFDFSYLDDNALILENYPIISQVKNVGAIFSNDVFFSSDKFYYRPLLNLSFMADASVAGALPVIFHLANILIHILASILIFLLLKKLGQAKSISFFLAAFFLVHPALTQAVAWIPGRNDSLLAVLVVAAFLSFLSFCDRPLLRHYLAYLGFLFLALLTKETAVFLPVLVIFYFLFLEPKRLKAYDKWLLTVGSGAIGFFWFLMRRLALGTELTDYSQAVWGIMKNSSALLIYIGKLLFPFDLKTFPILEDSTLIYGLLTILILSVAIWQSRRKRLRYVWFGTAWFLLFLLPAFIRPTGMPDFLEHRLYLSFVGFLIIVLELDWVKNMDFRKKSVSIPAILVLAFLAALSFRHSSAFTDRLSFWQSAAAGSPHSPLAQKNLGTMYYLDGDNVKAEEYYGRTLSLNDKESMVHNNLGVIYLNDRQYEKAKQAFERELQVNPNYDKALFNLGDLAYREKQWPAALDYWLAALRVNPRYYEAYERLLILEKQLR
jgi:hypothetical protein